MRNNFMDKIRVELLVMSWIVAFVIGVVLGLIPYVIFAIIWDESRIAAALFVIGGGVAMTLIRYFLNRPTKKFEKNFMKEHGKEFVELCQREDKWK